MAGVEPAVAIFSVPCSFPVSFPFVFREAQRSTGRGLTAPGVILSEQRHPQSRGLSGHVEDLGSDCGPVALLAERGAPDRDCTEIHLKFPFEISHVDSSLAGNLRVRRRERSGNSPSTGLAWRRPWTVWWERRSAC